MDIEEDLKILQEFTELDRKLRNYKVESDYDNFCERRCVAIDHILSEREEDKKIIEELEEENRVQRHQIMEVFDRDYIHKDKIKEIKNKFFKEYHKIYIKSNILSEKEKLNLEEKAKLQECTVLMQEIGCFIDNLQEILEDK